MTLLVAHCDDPRKGKPPFNIPLHPSRLSSRAYRPLFSLRPLFNIPPYRGQLCALPTCPCRYLIGLCTLLPFYSVSEPVMMLLAIPLLPISYALFRRSHLITI
ncbi:hypothetical protein N7501_011263 [Penicillium viridicatum]|nr:hypothetical protein N7501_011263 [Penicillium viridicatum]